MIRELQSFGVKVHVHDPIADSDRCVHEYGIGLTEWVAHRPYKEVGLAPFLAKLLPGGVFTDVKSVYDADAVRNAGHTLWRL